jgi:methylmalonyl-CoA/ethylmalonyl-CoA epimerase
MPTPTALAQSCEIRFHHGAISVPDLAASIVWWHDMLGFELEWSTYMDVIPAKLAFLRRGDLRIELFECPTAAPLPPERRDPDSDARTHGTKHMCFAVKDVHAFIDDLKSRGADIVFVKDVPNNTVAYIRDNAGNLFEFCQPPDSRL